MSPDRTAQIYEAHAAAFRAEREPSDLDHAVAFGRRAARGPGGPVVDLGSGPGWYTPHLGRQVVAHDVSKAMLDFVPEYAPDAWAVQATLEDLPFRRTGLGGAYASKCYVHVSQSATPLALADLHRSLAVGAPLSLRVFEGDQDLGPIEDDDYPGRQFSQWPEQRLRDVLVGAGFTIDELRLAGKARGKGLFDVDATRARTLPDTVSPRMRLLVCGLNPAIYAADRGVGFARPGNRFWPAAIAAGLVTNDRDPWDALRSHGVGMTDVVKRATARADELTADEYVAGMARVERLVAWLRPRAICFVGLAGWRAAVDRKAVAGPQPTGLAGVPVYVMPSTSGVNGHSSLADLTGHLGAAADLAQ